MKKITHVAALTFFLVIELCCIVTGQERDRDSWQQPEKIMDVVGIKPGMVIGEAGAGEGYFTFFLAKRVGDLGKIYANDIDESALNAVERRCKSDSINNITTILGKEDDPMFPQAELDMVIMMLAFHHFAKPVAWMKNVLPSMKPGAPLVIIDQDPNKTGRGWNHFMTKEEILKSMQSTDFELARIETFLERDNIYIFYLKKNQR